MSQLLEMSKARGRWQTEDLLRAKERERLTVAAVGTVFAVLCEGDKLALFLRIGPCVQACIPVILLQFLLPFSSVGIVSSVFRFTLQVWINAQSSGLKYYEIAAQFGRTPLRLYSMNSDAELTLDGVRRNVVVTWRLS